MTTNWADDVELEEQRHGPMDDFPPLGAEPAPKPKGKPKKGKQSVSLKDFLGGGPAVSMGRGPVGKDILYSLPTASRGKEEGDESGGGLGGAFKEYGNRGEYPSVAVTLKLGLLPEHIANRT
jgi:hypothetical protein